MFPDDPARAALAQDAAFRRLSRRTVRPGARLAACLLAEAAAAPKDDEVYLSRNEVMEIFGVSSTTLWRWSRDYLVPEKIGNSVRYRMSDIQKRMEESKHVND